MEPIANNKLMVSMYKSFVNNLGDKNFVEILNDIKTEKYQSDIKSIRYAIHKGDQSTADKIKAELPAFTTSATFGKSRTKANINNYSQLICLDFDHIEIAQLGNTISTVNNCNYTFASFISPSGDGLKVFIKVNSNDTQHTIAYNQVANFYKMLSGNDFDPKCKDVSRLCFVSSDSECYLNENAITFQIQKEVKVEKPKKIVDKKKEQVATTEELLDKCLKFTEEKEQYTPGNRNNFVHLFASNANRFGIFESDTLNFCITNFDLDEKEITTTVKSTYKNQSADFAKFAKFANLQSEQNETSLNKEIIIDEEDVLKTTPLIPQSVYDNLPPILFECCKVFKEVRERDTFLTGALAILSGCLPNVSGVYSGSTVYPSLFSFILAPAASGKGALKYAKALADKYHDKLIAESREAFSIYEEHLAAYKMLKSKSKLEEGQGAPIAPKFKVVYIPANTSNAKVIQHLDWNEGKGIICETEADTLGQTFKNEWGSYSDMLRKSFHHEKISVSRKTDAEFVEVNEPQLSVALSGTPKQIFNIISSAEDGLFSRFIFYVFKTDAVWMDVSPKGNPVNLSNYFKTQSIEVLKMVEYYERDSLNLLLTDEQWNELNKSFSTFLQQVNTFVSDDALSVVKRLGIILYRFCMIFSAIRKFNENNYHPEIYCTDTDFQTALTLVTTYLEHSVIMFNNLPKQGEQGPFKTGEKKKQFFDALPLEFKRKEAIELGISFKLSGRTVDNLLKDCLGKHLKQPLFGVYNKIL